MSQTARSQGRQRPSGTPVTIRTGADDESGVVLSANLRAVPIALVVTAVHGLLTWWRLSRSWFWQDDINLLANAADKSLGELMFADYNGHLVPGSWVVAWLSNHVATMSWGFVGAVLLLFVVGTDLALLGLLVRLFGRRPAILLPFTIFCATTLTTTATVWAAASLQWMPTTLALALGLYFLVGYVERPNAGDLWGGVGATVLGLFFFEKALTIPLVLALVTVAYFVPGPLWVRPWRAFRRYVLFWLAQGVVAGLYLWLYLSRATIDASESKPAGDYVELVQNMILRTYLPGLLGGPLDWLATPQASLVSWSNPPSWMQWTSWVVAGVVIAGSTLLVRGAWRAWALLLVFLAVSVTLVARARLGLVGPFIGRDHRYLTDAALFGVVCLALALFKLRPGLDRALHGDPPPRADDDEDWDDDEPWPTAVPDRDVAGYDTSGAYDGSGEDGDEEDEDDVPPRRQPSRVRAALIARARYWHDTHGSSLLLYSTLVMAMVTVGGVISSEQYMKTWEQNPAPAYFFNLEYGLRDSQHPHPIFMFDQAVPPLVMTPTFEHERMLSHVTKIYGDDAPVFGWWSPRFLVADDQGKLTPGRVLGPAATPPNGLACSDPAQPDRGVSLTLPAPPPDWEWKIELTYSADRDTAARVAYGAGPAVPVRLRKGLNVVVVQARGAGPAVSVTGLGPDATVCIGKVVVGNGIPDPAAVQGATS